MNYDYKYELTGSFYFSISKCLVSVGAHVLFHFNWMKC